MSNIKKINLKKLIVLFKGNFDYLVRSRLMPLPPKHLSINVTYRCNSRCKMCNIWQYEHKKEMSLQEIVKVLEDPIFDHVEDLAINGGEPTLRKDVVDIVASCIKRMGRLDSITYNTNGFLTDRIVRIVKRTALLCNEKNIHFTVHVSLDGVGKIHDIIRGVNRAFEKTTRTINELKKIKDEYGFFLGTSCVVSKMNIDYLGELEQWREKEELGQGYILVGFHDTYVNNLDKQDELGFNFTQSKEKVIRFLKKRAKEKSLMNFQAFHWNDLYNMIVHAKKRQTICPLIVDGAAFDTWGNVSYCLSEPSIGNLKTDGSFGKIYYSKENLAKKAKIRTKRCPECESGCMVDIGVRNNILLYLKFLLFSRIK